MKKGRLKVLSVFAVVLLVCVSVFPDCGWGNQVSSEVELPASGLESVQAVITLGDDNHTDTEDYCMRAHDVQMTTSEVQHLRVMGGKSQLESAVIMSAQVRVIKRELGRLTEDLSADDLQFDFSQCTWLPTGGYADAESFQYAYPIKVSAPGIATNQLSSFYFFLYIVDDGAPAKPDNSQQTGATQAPNKTDNQQSDDRTKSTTSSKKNIVAQESDNSSALDGFAASAENDPVSLDSHESADSKTPAAKIKASETTLKSSTGANESVVPSFNPAIVSLEAGALVVLSMTGVVLAILIAGDLRILRWYAGKKRENSAKWTV